MEDFKVNLSRRSQNVGGNWLNYLKKTGTEQNIGGNSKTVKRKTPTKQLSSTSVSVNNKIIDNKPKNEENTSKTNSIVPNNTKIRRRPNFGIQNKTYLVLAEPTTLLIYKNDSFLHQPNVIGSRGVRPIFDSDQCVAIDCEMVGVRDGAVNMLARVSLVNMHGKCVYDTFVKAVEPVVDYRTEVSGVRKADVEEGAEFLTVRRVVATLIHRRLLVGHALRNDLSVLGLKFPNRLIRDTSKCSIIRELVGTHTPSLKRLSSEILHVTIQEGEHSSIEDAKAAMKLYLKFRHEWEKSLKKTHTNVAKHTESALI